MTQFPPMDPLPPSDPALFEDPTRQPDPGRRVWALAAAIGTVLLLGLVVVLNQIEHHQAKPAPVAGVTAPDVFDPFASSAKLFVKIKHAMPPLDANSRDMLLANIDTSAKTNTDRVRAVVAAAEIADAEAGLSRLGKIEFVEEESDLRADAETIRAVLEGRPADVDEAQRAALVERHGWFGKLVLQFGQTGPERDALVAGGGRVIAVLVGAIVVLAGALIGGLVCFVVMIVLIAGRSVRRRFEPPLPGGSVYLEIVPVFIAAFLLVQLVGYLVAQAIGAGAGTTVISMAAQWALLLVMFYPLLRGESIASWRQRIGWHSGAGVLREVGAGIFAYFAGLPLLALAVGATFLYLVIRAAAATAGGGAPPAPPKNPIADLISSASTLELVMLFTLATIWAPLVEETIFRGGLYRHLRSRWPVWVSAVVSALTFGLMHNYDLFLMTPVITLGFVFAMMREWRGSLIAPITAHCLHNATIMTLVMGLMSVLKD